MIHEPDGYSCEEIRILNLDTGKFCRTYETEAGAKGTVTQSRHQGTRLAAVRVTTTVVEVLSETDGAGS